MQAVYYLLKVGGYKNVTFMQGGFLGWDSAGLPVTPFSDPDAQPFAQRNVGKMASILFFLVRRSCCTRLLCSSTLVRFPTPLLTSLVPCCRCS